MASQPMLRNYAILKSLPQAMLLRFPVHTCQVLTQSYNQSTYRSRLPRNPSTYRSRLLHDPHLAEQVEEQIHHGLRGRGGGGEGEGGAIVMSPRGRKRRREGRDLVGQGLSSALKRCSRLWCGTSPPLFLHTFSHNPFPAVPHCCSRHGRWGRTAERTAHWLPCP